MKSKKKTILIIVAVVIVVIAAAAGSGNSNKGSSSLPVNSGISTTDSAVYRNDSYQTTQSFSPVQTTAYWDGPQEEGYVSSLTPGHAGANVRSQASRDATLLTTLPEGEFVIYFPQSYNNGYVYCNFTHNGINTGWVLREYIVDEAVQQTNEEPQTSYYSSGPRVPGFVSLHTPGNAGLNVRSAASSDSALLTTIAEGESLFYFPDTIQNGYIYCELSGLPGGIAYGWLLAEYVMAE